MKTRRWILLFCAVLALCAAALLLRGRTRSDRTVLVYQDGVLVKTLDADPAAPYTVTISGPRGSNTLRVGGGTVEVTEADCKNQVCVRHGPLRRGGGPIVCLPRRLVIEWASGDGDTDAVSGAAG